MGLVSTSEAPVNVSDLRGYGAAFSDLESLWSPEMKARMKKDGLKIVMSRLGFFEKFRFGLAFLSHKRRAAALDLSDLQARGMTNQPFLAQQLEYLALYAALEQVTGADRAQEIALALMDATAREPMLACLPDPAQVRALGDPVEVFRDYFLPASEAARRAGCMELHPVQEPDSAGFDVTWCVWLELARRMGVPDACKPNCYSDNIAFPDYFRALGITYERTGTLAQGCARCDFRFRRTSPDPEEQAQNSA
jgi:hypothetical protein